jgi:CO dehydrogenase maturation factor
MMTESLDGATIALAGKGGTGKTTIAALVIKYLVQSQPGAVLAIDADPSSNLNIALGTELGWTVGDIREDMLSNVKKSLTQGGAAMGSLAGGMTKREYLDYQIQTSLIEGNQFDLIAMGRSEGSGCYCAVNHNLREVLDAIRKNYRFCVIDNEAGMEHLSRRTSRDIDHLLVISDPTERGLVTAERIASYRKELDINIKNTYLILNRLTGEIPPSIKAHIDRFDIPLLGIIPSDSLLLEYEYSSKPIVNMPDDSSIYQALVKMLQQILT